MVDNKTKRPRDADDWEILNQILQENPSLKRRVLHKIEEICRSSGIDIENKKQQLQSDRTTKEPKKSK